jgi:hypothetical protein
MKGGTLVAWTDPYLKRIVRLKLTGPPRFPWLQVAECVGEMESGELVNVQLPFSELPRVNYYGAMLDWARREGVYLRGLGIFNHSSIVVLNSEV